MSMLQVIYTHYIISGYAAGRLHTLRHYFVIMLQAVYTRYIILLSLCCRPFTHTLHHYMVIMLQAVYTHYIILL